MVESDKSGCPFDAPHVHEYHGLTSYYNRYAGGSFVINASKYTNDNEWARFDNATSSNYTRILSWQS